jgi:ribosomal protein L37E
MDDPKSPPSPPPTESITCPKCGMTSYNPNDVLNGYCGNCHEYTGLHPSHQHTWVYVDDEYGSLADGGSYEIYDCSTCGKRKYVQLPD